MRTLFLAWVFACGAAVAADEPEAVYARLHAAALAEDADTLRSCVVEAERETFVVPLVPKTYRLTGKAVRRDGNAVELRASGTALSLGLGYTQMFGVIGLVREDGEWKVERLSWSTERPGEYPEGYVRVEGPAPEPKSTAEAPRFRLPPSPPEPSRLYNPKRAADEPREPVPGAERAAPECVIKPVMTDDELRACGVRIPE
ncbi:MAG TPA: hypothetical protein VF211_04635 [Burkholderiales bacterium]